VGGEGGAAWTSFVGAWFDCRAAEPTVGEFVVGWWFAADFVVGGVVGGGVAVVEFFAVHVGVGADATSLHRPIHPQRQVP